MVNPLNHHDLPAIVEGYHDLTIAVHDLALRSDRTLRVNPSSSASAR
jgi:hypothetical protein